MYVYLYDYLFCLLHPQKNLRLHEALHVKDNLVCPECDKSFRRLASFKAHLSVHEEDESVTCDICHEEFISLVSFPLNPLKTVATQQEEFWVITVALVILLLFLIHLI